MAGEVVAVGGGMILEVYPHPHFQPEVEREGEARGMRGGCGWGQVGWAGWGATL